jgi:hypothetical protein
MLSRQVREAREQKYHSEHCVMCIQIGRRLVGGLAACGLRGHHSPSYRICTGVRSGNFPRRISVVQLSVNEPGNEIQWL